MTKFITKKFLAAISTLAAFLLLPQLAFAATLSLSPATGTINKGCTFTVNIELDTTGTQTDGTDVILLYEPTKLTATAGSIVNGKIYQDYPGNSVDSANGKISISGISSVSSPFNGKGTFATINFTVVDSASSNSTNLKFDFDPNDKTKTTDTNVVERGTIADVLTQVTDGDYTLGTGACGAGAKTVGGNNSTGGGSSSSRLPGGGPLDDSSSSGTLKPAVLPQGGLLDSTIAISAVGSLLVILGIIGLRLL